MPLDYYAVTGDGLVVERFTIAADHTTTGLHTAQWSVTDRQWRSRAAYSQAMRTDPGLRDRVVPLDRRGAERAYRDFCGGLLPDEPTLRTFFAEQVVLPAAAPLNLVDEPLPAGCRERRNYRILFAKDADADLLSRGRRASLRAEGDAFTWELRRIGGDLAWCVDVTAYLGGRDEAALGALLRRLTAEVRHQGLIPVTVERLA